MKSGFARRGILVGGGLALVSRKALAFAETPPSARVVADWEALERAVASRDPEALIRARLNLGILYAYPAHDLNESDRQAVIKLLEANFAPEIARLDRGAAAFSRLFWAKIMLGEQRAVTQRQLPRIRRELKTAGQLVPDRPAAQLEICIAAGSAALLARDLDDADKWLGLGLRILPHVKVPAPRDGVSRETMQAGVLAQVSEFLMLCARLSALYGRPDSAIYLTEQAIGASPVAARAVSASGARDTQLLRHLAAAAQRFAAVVHLPLTIAGSSLIITRWEGSRARSTIHELASATGPSFDDKELQILQWGDLLKDTYAKGFWSGWQGIYQAMDAAGTSAGPTFRRGLPGMAERFWTHFVRHIVAALKARGVKQGDKVAFVLPHGLSLFPLRIARDPATGMTLNHFCVACQGPDCASLARVSPPPRQAPGRLAGIFNPTRDLPGADAERALVGALFPDTAMTAIKPGLTGPGFVDAIGRSNCNFLYCATHGSFGYAQKPGLAIGPNTRLSLDDLEKHRSLFSARLVVLSACETGVTPLDSLSPLPQSLPHVLLGLGAQGVIASLWKVNDDSTALLMHETMRLHLTEGVDPPAALTRAQLWLSNANAPELVEYLTNAMDRQPDRDWSLVAEMAARLSAHDDAMPPFAHPYYWGAFAYYGS